jgi:hypothetical protein
MNELEKDLDFKSFKEEDIKMFWDLIDESIKKSKGVYHKKYGILTELLSKRKEREIVVFGEIRGAYYQLIDEVLEINHSRYKKILNCFGEKAVKKNIKIYEKCEKKGYDYYNAELVEVYYDICDMLSKKHLMGDDGFMDFKNWIISMGFKFYKNAICDFQSILDYLRNNPRDIGNAYCGSEEFYSVPAEAYTLKTGNDIDKDPYRVLKEKLKKGNIDTTELLEDIEALID